MIGEVVGLEFYEGIPIWGGADARTIEQIKRCARTAEKVALMADNHLGYAVPIGGVVAYRDAISPSGVGYDIACGNKAVLTDMPAVAARAGIERIMDDIQRKISFGMGRHNEEKVDHELFDDPAWSVIKSLNLRDKAAAQLGTVGSGNHYVDIFVDGEDRVWVGAHFGSRGLGHGIAHWALERSGVPMLSREIQDRKKADLNKHPVNDSMDAEPVILHEGSDLFDDYLAAMTLAGRYAYAGRDWVVNKVVHDILGAKILAEVHNNHNFAWRELHDGKWLWVVRKGATPAFPGQLGFVGGTMGDMAVILEGVHPGTVVGEGAREALQYEQELGMYSTVHGAGRAMSRTAAAGKIKKRKLIREGLIASEYGIHNPWELTKWLEEERGVILRGGGLDEAPQAYKKLDVVLASHRRTINVLDVLKPIGVAMASPEIRDPFKD